MKFIGNLKQILNKILGIFGNYFVNIREKFGLSLLVKFNSNSR